VGLSAMPHERDPDQRGREELAGELATVRDRYRALFETLPFGVIRYSADGLILEANPAAGQIMGMPPADMLTWPLPTAAHPVREDGSELTAGELPLEVALRTGAVIADEMIGIPDPQTGEPRWLKVTAVPYQPDEAGQPRRGYVIFRDVTEQHRLDEALRDQAAAAARERAARTEAQLAQDRLSFLIRAGQLVTAAADRDELLSRATALAVPGLADLCVTFLPGEGGTLRATSVAHRDPDGEVIVTDLRDFRLPRTGPLFVQAAWESGRTIVKESWRAKRTGFGSPLQEIADQVDPRSVLAVPLMAGERPLGVITLSGQVRLGPHRSAGPSAGRTPGVAAADTRPGPGGPLPAQHGGPGGRRGLVRRVRPRRRPDRPGRR
jgi:PAS domain S-box-containing protein